MTMIWVFLAVSFGALILFLAFWPGPKEEEEADGHETDPGDHPRFPGPPL